jgi:hypothetical protein
MELVDYKIYKFAASIIKYKYLKEHKLEESQRVLVEMKQEYQEILRVLKDLTKSRNLNLKHIAYIVDSLLDAREFITVDTQMIEMGLDYIASKQNLDGTFPYNPDLDSRRDIGAPGVQSLIQDALVILPFLKDQELKMEYQSFISNITTNLNKSISDDSNDYEKVIVANALILDGKYNPLESVNLKKNFKSSSYAKHKPMFIEIVSYLIHINHNLEDNLKWLVNEMKSKQGFYSPYDAILATKALYKASKTYDKGLNSIRTIAENNKNNTLFESFTLTSSINTSREKVEIIVNSAYVSKSRNPTASNIVMIEVNLPAGYKYHSNEQHDYIKVI